MSRIYTTDTGRIHRVIVEYLTSDGEDVYMARTYGPYTTLRAARSQATRLGRSSWPKGPHKRGRVESAHIGDWAMAP